MQVRTKYKRKGVKVKPVKAADGTAPGGDPNWLQKRLDREKRLGLDKPKGPFDRWLTPKFSNIPRGTRLTPERIETLHISPRLRPKEREMLIEMLYNREAALAWTMEEKGLISRDIEPPHVIRVRPHEPWVEPSYRLRRKLLEVEHEHITRREKAGLIEDCHGPYRNPCFFVPKKNGKYRFIISCTKANGETLQDAGLPPNVEEFAEGFAGYPAVTVVDFFMGYEQVELDERSRDLMAFQTSRGLKRPTVMVQGATNSVADFVRRAKKIIYRWLGNTADIFVDDVGIRGPRETYNDEDHPDLPGVRRWVLEHIVNVDNVLADIERAGATVSGEKSQWVGERVEIVGFGCDASGRHPVEKKVEKIVRWKPPTEPKHLRAFLGVCVYYHIWIPKFAVVADPLFLLLKKDVEWQWDPEVHQPAMDALKAAITSAPALKTVDYSSSGRIIVSTDASATGWGAVLQQEEEEKSKVRHPCRYESGVWRGAEIRYDAGKRECRAILKAFRKLRVYLYGVRFVLETDARTLVHQLNLPGSDLPGAAVTRWLAWLRLFSFDVVHVPGEKNGAADGLSRRPPHEDDDADEEDVEDMIEADLYMVSVHRWKQPDITTAPEEWQQIIDYLSTLRRPDGMNDKDFRKFRQYATRYLVFDGALFKRSARPDKPPIRVVFEEEERARILESLHEESGHRGREGTFAKIAERYWWPGLYEDVRTHVSTCRECQLRKAGRREEPLHTVTVSTLWERIGVDVVHMPETPDGYRYLVMAREYLSRWPEGLALKEATSDAIAAFLHTNIFCRYGVSRIMIVDGGPENKDAVEKLSDRFGMYRLQVVPYHPESNGLVERGHQPIVDALSKLTECSDEPAWKWKDHLNSILWADRTTVKRTTGYAPYRLLFGMDCVLPIEAEIMTWNTTHWGTVTDTESLLAARARQLERRPEDLARAVESITESRAGDKRRHDAGRNIRHEPFEVGDLVLMHETRWEKSHDKKLSKRWSGPYKIIGTREGRGTYQLAELDGTALRDYQTGSRLKLFRQRFEEERDVRAPFNPEASREEQMWEIHDIVGKRTVNGKQQYLVKWVGYPRKTWEPVENLDRVEDFIRAFEERQRTKRRRKK